MSVEECQYVDFPVSRQPCAARPCHPAIPSHGDVYIIYIIYIIYIRYTCAREEAVARGLTI